LIDPPAPTPQGRQACQNGGEGPSQPSLAAPLTRPQLRQLVLEPNQQVLQLDLASNRVAQMVVPCQAVSVGPLDGTPFGLVVQGVARLAEIGVATLADRR